MAEVHARHIEVATEEQCVEIMKKIEAGGDFATYAMKYSKCPSAKKGGDLGVVEPGKMGEEFDKIIFQDEDVNVLKGPVKTAFGYHLVEVTSRSD